MTTLSITAQNALIRTLNRSGLLAEDLDYHLIRAAMVIMFFFFGYQKWFPYEFERLVPFLHRNRHHHSVHAGRLGRRGGRIPCDDRQRPLPDEGCRSARGLVLPPQAGPGSLDAAMKGGNALMAI
jgi:hypothetical protein